MSYYSYFTDPVWQSIGAIISGAGVFLGVWLANKSRDKETKKNLLQTVEITKENLIRDINLNKELVGKMKYMLKQNPPILSAFDALLAGSNFLAYETWGNTVRNNVYPELTLKQRILYNKVFRNVRDLKIFIKVEVSEWKRIFEFDTYYELHPEKNVLRVDLRENINQKTLSLKQQLDIVEESIVEVLEQIKNDWYEDINSR
ncbi:hypothetical protein NBRC13296_12520 [Paenibacillus chitinolyticus]|uniref:hypothetical protein n=1 Tax=Paenibacillus chitinolyticus TaxID=79263 RepID=UPI00355835FF